MEYKTSVNIRYGDRDYKTDYLDWYFKAKNTGLSGMPGWVIKIGDFFSSSMKGDLSKFYPLYGFTQSISSFAKAGSLAQNTSDSSLQLEKAMIIIPQEASYTKLLDSQVRRANIEEFTIRKLQQVVGEVQVENEYTYKNGHIDHIEIVNGNELAILFSYKRLKIVENVWGDNNAKKGMLAYEIELDSGELVLG